VNALDLCGLAAIRRFFPGVYEVIWTNAAFFSNSYSSWKFPSYRSEQALAAEAEKVSGLLAKAWEGTQEDVVNALIGAHVSGSREGAVQRHSKIADE
jgi:hypothetical protein